MELNPEDFIDPPGYPFTTMEYLKVLDSFAGGFQVYENYPVSIDCMASLEKKFPYLESTYLAWTEVNLLNDGFTKYDNETGQPIYNNWNEPLEDRIYNVSEAVSFYFAPIQYNCSLFGYRYAMATYTHYS